MSLGWTHYDVLCCHCGNRGSVSIWTDDWYRWKAKWTGFNGTSAPNGPRLESVSCNQCKKHNLEVTRRQKDACFHPVDPGALAAGRLHPLRRRA
jgi:hypothetical protein